MKFYLTVLFLISCMQFSLKMAAQETAPAPVRTPEQEATLQTQKMQKELNLNNDQLQTIYEINLKHARERQVSNSRSQALERTKNKNSEIRKVLTPDQYNRLQDKRYERYPSGVNTYTNPGVTQPSIKRSITSQPGSRTSTDRTTRDSQVRTPTTQPRSRDTRAITPSTNRSTFVTPPTRNSTPAQDKSRNSRSTPPPTNSGSSERTQRR